MRLSLARARVRPHGTLHNLDAALDAGVRRIGHGAALASVDGVRVARSCGARKRGKRASPLRERERERLLSGTHGKRASSRSFGEVLAHEDTGRSEALLRRCVQSGVTVEVCLTSICTAARVPSFAEHPILAMRAAGVRIALGCDNYTLSGDPATAADYLYADFSYAHPAGEIAHLRAHLGLDWSEIRTILLDSVRAGFAVDTAFVANFTAELDTALQAALHPTR